MHCQTDSSVSPPSNSPYAALSLAGAYERWPEIQWFYFGAGRIPNFRKKKPEHGQGANLIAASYTPLHAAGGPRKGGVYVGNGGFWAGDLYE